MQRRSVLQILGGTIGMTLAPALTGAQGADRKPNFIIIMADDLGYGDIGCYGNQIIKTPNIDALAKGGMRFTNYHSNGAVCSPTRAALVTGRYQQRSGIEGVVTAARHRKTGLDLKEVTFANVLKTAGYATAIFGKWHLGYAPEFNPVNQGFDEFRGFVSGNIDYHSHIDQEGYEDWWQGDTLKDEKGYSTDLVSDHGSEYIKRNKDKPFCLYLAHEAPHYPYQGRNDKADRSPGKPKPIGGSRKDKAGAYKEMIEAMDEGVGKIVETVKAQGLEKNTLIVFCSDNGAAGAGSNGPLRGRKGQVWEGGHRVPAIAYWPGKIKPGEENHDLYLSMDLFPTMTALAGAALPKNLNLDGIPLPFATKEKPDAKRIAFWKHHDNLALHSGQWKVVIPSKGQPQLFNLEDDLGEKNNLSKEHPELTTKLAEQLKKMVSETTKGVERRS